MTNDIIERLRFEIEHSTGMEELRTLALITLEGYRMADEAMQNVKELVEGQAHCIL